MGGMASSAGYSSSSYRTSPFRFTTDDLIEAIVTTIEPDSWDDVGGEGSLLMIGGKLVIRQTNSVHEQVAELLDALRSEGSAMTSVVIEAHWLLLDRATRAELVQHGNLVDSDRLKQIADDAAAQGQITCLDGQTVHLLAGNVRSLITSVIPVVGQHQPTEREGSQDAPTTEMINPRVLAQFASGMEGGMGGVSDSRHVGYQPVSQVVNFGAVLQITPAVVPQPRSILIDLQSVVVLPPQVSTPGVSFEPVIKLDQLNLVAQQFMTTIRMPMDQPVIVGGSTLQPFANGASTGDEAKRLYLVIRASTAD